MLSRSTLFPSINDSSPQNTGKLQVSNDYPQKNASRAVGLVRSTISGAVGEKGYYLTVYIDCKLRKIISVISMCDSSLLVGKNYDR